MSEKFRLKSIVIEGFKGFTSSQEIKLNAKSSFIFGPNGWGKSSILEAISWCMFGLDRENESEIRNRDYYCGDCRVEIILVRGEEECKVTRKLRPDSGKSDVEVLWREDEKKEFVERNLTDIFPQLRKLGGRGANVLFAQQGTTHRFVGDLNKFKDVIDAYSGLDRLEKLRNLLREEIKLKKNHYEEQIKRNWSGIENDINNKINDVESKLREISSNPPWVGPSPPDESKTETKVRTLYNDVVGLLQVSTEGSISTLPMDRILNKIDDMLRSPPSVERLNDAINEKRRAKSSLENMKSEYENILTAIEQIKNRKLTLETELRNLLTTGTEEELERKKERLDEESNKLRCDLETAVNDYTNAGNSLITELPEIEREIKKLNTDRDKLSSLEREISGSREQLENLTRDARLDELENQLNELKNQGGKLSEYLKLINGAHEYCSKYGCTCCLLCDSEHEILPKLSEKIKAIPQEISGITNGINSLNDRIQNIIETNRKLIALEREKEELIRSMPENPDDKLKELEDRKQNLIQQEEIARNKKDQLSKEVPEKRAKIQNEISSINEFIKKITSLQAQIQNLESQLKSLDENKKEIEENVKKTLRFPMDTEINSEKLKDAIKDAIVNIGSEIKNLDRECLDKTSDLNTYKSRLKDLRREVEYHSLLKRSAVLSEFKDSEDWKQVERQIKEFLTLLDSVREIFDALGDAYADAFRTHLTAINQKVCDVYKTLTAQRSYPDAKVSQISSDSSSIEIIMEVGVSERNVWRKPMEVLNEQARNAVVLVPYFAFSELGMLQHDLDFLLIDDPSRSFDVAHLDSLMKLLKSVSDHAQVILATHEREKFEGPAKELFGQNASILEIESFDPASGPKINEV